MISEIKYTIVNEGYSIDEIASMITQICKEFDCLTEITANVNEITFTYLETKYELKTNS